jgi:hypothetical protein
VFTLPSFRVSVTTEVATETPFSVFEAPPGAFARLHGPIPAEYTASVSPNVALTWSTWPSSSTSNI